MLELPREALGFRAHGVHLAAGSELDGLPVALLAQALNLRVAIGELRRVALVLFGVVGLIFASGAVVISRDLSAAYGVVAQNAARIVSAQAPTVAIGMLMLTLMLSVWWWVEHEDAAI